MKQISQKLFPYLISLLFIFPIIKESLSSFIVILICLNTVIYKITSNDYSLPKLKTLLLTIPFWIILFRSFFTDNFTVNAIHIQHALFFLIIPFFFSFIPQKNFGRQKMDLYILILKITCLLIAVIYVFFFFLNHSLSEFFVVFQNVSTFRNFVYYDFKLITIHPTYFTTLLVFCSAHSFDLVLKQKKYSEFVFIISFLLISLLLLTRLNIVLLVLTLVLMVFLRSKMKSGQKIGLSAAIIAFVVALSISTPGIKHRFVELFHSYDIKPENIAYDSTNIRRAIFDCSVSISKDNFLYGVGFENLQNDLNDCYKSNYDSSFYEGQNYMTHNYYFYILLSSGILGLILFLIYLINILKLCLRSNIFLFKIFIFNVLTICLIEDYLYRHYGILYFNLMLICFIQYSKNKELDTIEIR